MHHPPDRIAHTTAFVTPVVEHWLERETTPSIKTKIVVLTNIAISSQKYYHRQMSHHK